ncbi:MAG: hypothetical protein LBS85_00860 [Clostridiales Family XIII bacterium]|nr:hypothetical protein [Clostridiales Family XIII bacterium]
MIQAKHYTEELMACDWFDITEEYEDLLQEWYGDSSAAYSTDDDDFADSFRALTKNYRFWHFDEKPMTSYERLRARYNALLDLHLGLVGLYKDFCAAHKEAAAPRDNGQRRIISADIKGGCKPNEERGISHINGESVA